MAFRFADRVKETTTVTGTGTLNLGGAATGFQTFVAGVGNSNTCAYLITDGTDWEVGIGTVTSGSPDTLSRDTVLASSNGGSKVNWASGNKDVGVVNPALMMGGGTKHVRSVTSDPSPAKTDHGVLYLGDASGGAFTVTLPAVSAVWAGFEVMVAKTDSGANAVTVDGNGAETINGAATRTLDKQHQAERYVCDGLGWRVLGVTRSAPGDFDVGNDLAVGNDATVAGDLAVTGAITGGIALPRSYLSGFQLSNNGADSAHDIDIAPGAARDSADALNLTLAATMTKRIDGNWAEGSGGGGFPTALTLTTDTWYRVFLIGKTDGTTDAGFDTSATAANLLSDASAYSRYRQIGWVRTYTGTGPDLRQVTQVGDLFLYDNPASLTLDHNASVTADTDTTITVTNAPPGTIARLHLYGENIGNEGFHLNAHPTSAATASHSLSAAPLANMGQSGASLSAPNSGFMSVQIDMPLDASGQFKVRSSSNITLRVLAVGWLDRRGRDD